MARNGLFAKYPERWVLERGWGGRDSCPLATRRRRVAARLRTADQPRGSRMASEWLGGRDSNPDNVVQSHVSYR
jgi:hypothetical protein